MIPRTRLRLGAVAALADAALLIGLSACSGSSPTSTGPIARFTADAPTPADGSVAMLEGTRSGPHVTVRVAVTGVNGFFGAAFRVAYDPASLVFEGMDTSTSFLRQGVTDNDVFFDENHTATSGEVVVTATRLDPTVGTANVAGTSDLVILKFGARKALTLASGLGRIDFADPRQVCDGNVVPPGCEAIPVTWSGGIVTAN